MLIKVLKTIIASILMLMIVAKINLQAKEIKWGNSIGLFGGANLNMHSPLDTLKFTFPPSTAVIPISINESTNSFTGFVGLEGNFQISKLFVITGRIGYDFAGLDYNLVTGNNVKTTNDLKTSLHYLEFAPMLKLVNVIPNLEALYFTSGINVGVPIIKKYDITQQIGPAVPRNNDGDIPETKIRMSIPIGIGYIFEPAERVAIIPEITYNLGLTDVSSNANWQSWSFNQLKGGISLVYKLPSKEKVTDTTTPTKINVGMDNVYYLDKNGNPQKVESIRLEESEYGEYFPLIPYIFYDINETEIPTEYVKKATNSDIIAGSPSEEILPDNATDMAYKVLDIIGKRLSENPNASLTITGTIDTKYETDMFVSEGRAREVQNYLVKNYNIPDSRLRVEHRGIPAKPSAQSVKDGIVENRRVELSSNTASIFDPVLVKGEKMRFATPDNIYFTPFAESNKPITAWELEIYQADRIVKQFSGENIEDEIRWEIMLNDLYPSELPIEYKYSVHSGESIESYIGRIKLDYISISKSKTIDQPDYVINKYSLVLFDFDSPLLTEQNKQVIDKFIIPNIKFGSSVDIYGYSDRIGQPEYNRRLSLQRANAVRDYIQIKNRNVRIRTNGLGNDTEIFDNEIPVGRQLSRTVQILVITPKE